MEKKAYKALKKRVGVIAYTGAHSPKLEDCARVRLLILLSSGWEVLYDLIKEEFHAILFSEDQKEIIRTVTDADFLNLYELAVDEAGDYEPQDNPKNTIE
ncbi:hypothetical protein EZS27_009187 [termite gut metagenome]|uniref:Uncharacterized protein n=1 Tax=termite gut metagenome TaxID=433724 RepID=A0A5J4SCZ7_9ZZZZ